LRFCGLEVIIVMLMITDTLLAEHRVFRDLFDEIETLLPELTEVTETRLLATLVERVLLRHAEVESSLAYAALDHALKQRGQLERLHQDHEEIDGSLRRARKASTLKQSRRLLKAAIEASRAHFRREERGVFPLLERVLQPETLAALGGARTRPRAVLAA
jgi:hemerythrin-like domain-containing protein